MFSPKKILLRKSASSSCLHTLDSLKRGVELGLEYGPRAINLGGQTLKFEDGQWITESGVREVQDLEKRNLGLKKENKLLKLMIETLLDMLTQASMEFKVMAKELEDIRANTKGRECKTHSDQDKLECTAQNEQ